MGFTAHQLRNLVLYYYGFIQNSSIILVGNDRLKFRRSYLKLCKKKADHNKCISVHQTSGSKLIISFIFIGWRVYFPEVLFCVIFK
jgi:hypothetical protein